MSEWIKHQRTSYKCVDGHPQSVTGLPGNKNGALFYFVAAECEFTGHCPPYINGAELTCVVCTR